MVKAKSNAGIAAIKIYQNLKNQKLLRVNGLKLYTPSLECFVWVFTDFDRF